ncbi:hypothetical protein HK104_006958, partial [Borealophlyctis nickersoniae]
GSRRSVVPEGGNTREEIERQLRAEYDRKLMDEVHKLKDEGERQLAIRPKEIAKEFNKQSLLADKDRITTQLDAYKKRHDDDVDKLKKNLDEAQNAEEKQQIQSKLDAAKKNCDLYMKRTTEVLESLNTQIQFLDATGDMGGPSTRETSL